MKQHDFTAEGQCRYCGCGQRGSWKPFAAKPCPNAPNAQSGPKESAAAKLRRKVRQRQINHGVLNALNALLEGMAAGTIKPPASVGAEELQMALEWVTWERAARGPAKPDGHRPGR